MRLGTTQSARLVPQLSGTRVSSSVSGLAGLGRMFCESKDRDKRGSIAVSFKVRGSRAGGYGHVELLVGAERKQNSLPGVWRPHGAERAGAEAAAACGSPAASPDQVSP